MSADEGAAWTGAEDAATGAGEEAKSCALTGVVFEGLDEEHAPSRRWAAREASASRVTRRSRLDARWCMEVLSRRPGIAT